MQLYKTEANMRSTPLIIHNALIMKTYNKIQNTSKGGILKIKPKSQDCYEVYFEFLPIPVEVNQSYLDTIVKDLNIDYNPK